MNGKNRGTLGTYLLYITTVVVLIALLAAFGFYHFEYGDKGTLNNFGDSLWWTIVTMTTIGYGDIYPKTLGGRLVAVGLMLIGIGTLGVSTAAIAAYFVKNDQLELLRVRRMRNHVIICGLGDKGLLLARAFHERGSDVIIIEKDETNILLDSAREQGSIVMTGDATDREMLTRARLEFARYIITVCGDDGTNAEVATNARELAGNRKGAPLTCSAHIVDPELWYLLRNWEISTVGSFRMQFFNVFDLGARALLAAHPPFINHTENPHLLIVGSGKLAQNIVLQASRLWYEHNTAGAKFKVTIVDRDTTMVKESLHLRWPKLDRICDVETLSIDISSPQFHHAAFLYGEHKEEHKEEHRKLSVTAIYVCLDSDSVALSAALALLHRIRHHKVPVVVQMNQDAGLATLLQAAQSSNRGFDRLHAVGLLEKICQPDLVLGGANEALAHAIHERYVRDQKRAGANKGDNASLVSWEDLPEDLKESNRRQADDIGTKLQTISCDIAPLTDWDAISFTFTPEEIEKMARMEHERWVSERQAQGWTFGPRDNATKKNPNLLPWDDLPEEGRERNRETIRELPDSLTHAGFQIYRLK